MKIKNILEQVAQGEMSVEDAVRQMESQSVMDLDFARLDMDRSRRCGVPEFIFCSGKTAPQVVQIIKAMKDAGHNVLASRASPELYDAVVKEIPDTTYHEAARAITLDIAEMPEPVGCIAVVSAGTSDIPVADEAGLVAERMGARVDRVYDVGVAGLHRLMEHVDRLKAARVLIVVAGMEGALPSVIGGLIDRPIIAVPTSVGYGMNLQGVTTFLAMLNSCVPGITVVNVDNGLGAGVAAAMINRIGEER